jgi:hypothetical protein
MPCAAWTVVIAGGGEIGELPIFGVLFPRLQNKTFQSVPLCNRNTTPQTWTWKELRTDLNLICRSEPGTGPNRLS